MIGWVPAWCVPQPVRNGRAPSQLRAHTAGMAQVARGGLILHGVWDGFSGRVSNMPGLRDNALLHETWRNAQNQHQKATRGETHKTLGKLQQAWSSVFH